MGNFALKSTAFKDGGIIPARHTCDGDDVNPFLEIRDAPPNTKSFALIVDDPDAPGGVWDHWLVWNIDGKTQYLSEDSIPAGAFQGLSGAGHSKWGGPCPPRGNDPHHYRFTLYALDTILTLAAGAKRAELEDAIAGHILAKTSITGIYERK
ncbi:MAG: YbhB/YbcL family Raf kinase inhibitor-like protein [Patescibacteria group bacterium]